MKDKMIKAIMFVLIFVALASFASASYWVSNPISCLQNDQSSFLGQSCAPNNICGNDTGTAQCYNTSLLTPPSTSSVSSAAYTGSLPGGFILDCYATADASAPRCDNSGGFWCNRNTTCYSTNFRETNCTANVWAQSTCGNCRSGYVDCDANPANCEVQSGSTNCAGGANNNINGACACVCDSGFLDCDAGGANLTNGCEIQTGVTQYGSEPHTAYNASCGASCTSGYLDCNGDLGTGGNGCEILNGGNCTLGGANGTYSGCSGGTGNCVITPQHHITGIEAFYSSSLPNLWTHQIGTGAVANFTNSLGQSIVINNESCIVFKDNSVQCNATGGSLGNFVPYVNATQNVDLNGKNLTSISMLGVGTNNPSERLSVNGTVQISSVVPRHAGSITNGTGGASLRGPSSVYISGKYAYVTNLFDNSFEIVDISNPTNPTHTGKITNGTGGALLEYPTSVYVAGKYAYITSYNSKALEIIDISNPTNPTHTGKITNGTGGANLYGARSVYVTGKYAYIASTDDSSLEIVDISNPTNPTHTGKIKDGTGGASLLGAYSVYVAGKYAYVAVPNLNTLEIVDISNPTNPTHTGKITNGTGGALLVGVQSVYISGKYAYLASTTSHALEIIDISNASNPTHTGKITDGTGGATLNYPYSVYVAGKYAYVTSAGNESLEIVDISNASNPTHTASIINGTGGAQIYDPWSVYVAGKYAYVTSTSSNALEIIDISGIDAPSATIGALSASNLKVTDNAEVKNDLSVGNGLMVGGNVRIDSRLSVQNNTYIGGNLGVGVLTPSYALDVKGNSSTTYVSRFESSNPAGAVISINSSGTGGRAFELVSTANTAAVGGGKFGIVDRNTTFYRFLIDNSGNVGIGTTSPTKTLTIDGTGVDITNASNDAQLCLNGQCMSNLTDFVPYTGAIQNVDLGNNSIQIGKGSIFNATTEGTKLSGDVIFGNLTRIVYTVDAPASAAASINTSGTGFFDDGSDYFHTYYIFAYRVINGTRFYSANSTVAATSSGGIGFYNVNVSWDAVPNADGYRIIIVNGYGAYWTRYDTTTNRLNDDNTFVQGIIGTDVSPSSPYTAVTQNDNVFFIYNSTTKYVGIGTGTPSSQLEISNDGQGSRGLTISQHSDIDASAIINLRRSKGNNIVPTIVGSTDKIGAIWARPYNGSEYGWTAAIGFAVNGTTPTGNNIPTDIIFATNPPANLTTLNSPEAEKMRLTAAGNLGIGTANPSQRLEVNGSANITQTVYAQQFCYQNGTCITETNVSGYVPYSGATQNVDLNAKNLSNVDMVTAGNNQTALALLVNEGAVMFNGTFGRPGVTPTNGSGVRLMWIPNKASFREGSVSGSEWNQENIGDYSLSVGENTIASGAYSSALGYNSTATGNYSFAVGNMAGSTGYASFATGYNTISTNDESTALGLGSTAAGAGSYAAGNYAVAGYRYNGNYTLSTKTITILGNHTAKLANGDRLRLWYFDGGGIFSNPIIQSRSFDGTYTQIVLVNDTIGSDWDPVFFVDTTLGGSTGWDSLAAIALGNFATATGGLSTAIGANAQSIGEASTAIGYFTQATGFHSTSIGDNNTASGTASLAMGNNTLASGNYSTAMGYGSQATDEYSMAIGNYAQATNNGSMALGSYTTSSGEGSTAMGIGTTASELGATAMGWATTASGGYSTAMGYNTLASGLTSTAMGRNTIASEWDATAMGLNTTASGKTSTAMGEFTTATGKASTAMGHNTTATGSYTTAIGRDINCSQDNATCIGGGNVGIGTGNPSQTLEVVGNAKVTGTVFADNISSNSPLQLQTNGTTRIYINDTSGFVGIGKNVSIEYQLEVKSSKFTTILAQTITNVTISGDYTGTFSKLYGVLINNNISTPNEFSWTEDGGTTWNGPMAITEGVPQGLSEGLFITFANETGHMNSSFLIFYGVAQGPLNLENADGTDIFTVTERGRVGINTIDPQARLDIRQDSGTIFILGDSSTYAAPDAIGAIGPGANASGTGSGVIGTGNAAGAYSSVIGSGTAIGTFSQSISGGTAVGEASLAIKGGYAGGFHSAAIGEGTISTGNWSTALGQNINCEQNNATCIGTGGIGTGKIGLGNGNPQSEVDVNYQYYSQWAEQGFIAVDYCNGDNTSAYQCAYGETKDCQDSMQVSGRNYTRDIVCHPSNQTISGNLGIGTASPRNRLAVNGDANISGTVYATQICNHNGNCTGIGNETDPKWTGEKTNYYNASIIDSLLNSYANKSANEDINGNWTFTGDTFTFNPSINITSYGTWIHTGDFYVLGNLTATNVSELYVNNTLCIRDLSGQCQITLNVSGTQGTIWASGPINATQFCYSNGTCLEYVNNSMINSKFVPYTGATQNVDLNGNRMTNVSILGVGTSTPQALIDARNETGPLMIVGNSISRAEGDGAIALGINSNVTGINSIALTGANVIGTRSIGFANGAVRADYAVAFPGSTALSNYSIAMLGQTGVGLGSEYTTAIGYSSFADKYYSTAIGYGARATQDYSTAIGDITCNAINTTCIGGEKVGIGIGNPVQRFEVNGNANITNSLYAQNFCFQNGTCIEYINSTNLSQTYVPYQGATKTVELGGQNLTNVNYLGIGTANPISKLHIVSAGSPALIIGDATTSATGPDSVAIGAGANSTGMSSFAAGVNAQAINTSSVAIGWYASAQKQFSVAIGSTTSALEEGSIAIGGAAVSSAFYGTSIGYHTTASGTSALALGYYTTASGLSSVSMGDKTTASGPYSVSVGRYINCTGTSMCLGNINLGIGTGSPRAGIDLYKEDYEPAYDTGNLTVDTCDSNNATRFTCYWGQTIYCNDTFSESGVNYTRIIDCGNQNQIISGYLGVGTISPAARLDVRTNESGPLVIIGDGTTSATGNHSIAIGVNSAAVGIDSTALGSNALAQGRGSLALTRGTTYGNDSIAMGLLSKSYATDSLAIAGGTTYGANSIAMGVNAVTISSHAIAMGPNSNAEGTQSIAAGYFSNASGSNSVALGIYSKSSADYSVGLGYNASATQESSVAIGRDTICSQINATCLGGAGNIGIGTSIPNQKLQVVGNANISDTIYANQFCFQNGTCLTGLNTTISGNYVPYEGANQSVDLNGQNITNVTMLNVTGTVYADNISSNSPLQLQTQGTTRIYINDTTGYVGINTTNPLARLDVREETGPLFLLGDSSTYASNVSLGAMGRGANATGFGSAVMGNGNSIGAGSFVLGSGTTEGFGSMAIGGGRTTADFAMVVGGGNATAQRAMSMGYSASAQGNYSTAIGHSTASGTYSTSIGKDINCSQDNATCIGGGNVGIGTGNPQAKIHAYSAGGPLMILGDSTATGNFAIAAGEWSDASGNYSLAVGDSTKARGYGSVALGQWTTADGSNSLATGYGTNATGTFSTAMGQSTTANGWGSTAMGISTTATGAATTAMGMNIICSQDNATCMGGNVGIGAGNPSAALHINASNGDMILATNDSGNVFRIANSGEVFTDAAYSTPAADVAERFEINGAVNEGDVVVIDTEKDETLRRSSKEYDSNVAGVVSTKPGLKLGEKGEYIALAGRVPVNVDGEVFRGDLLVTSNKAGKAMRCADKTKCAGAIVGKALTNSKDGRVIAIISLQ